MHQTTLAGPAIFAGVGLHTGVRVRAAILPAPAGSGVTFLRTDVRGDNCVSATADNVVNTRLGTVIGNDAGVTVSTIEHLMAALAALDVDNCVIELDGPEVPVMDGSSEVFVKLIDQVGRRRQEALREYVEVLKPIVVSDGDKCAALYPAPRFELAFEIDFASPAIGRQRVDLVLDEQMFRDGLSDCRTFGFAHEVEALRRAGLARGGSLDNAVVIEDDRVINPEGLRRPDEFVRHKALDAVGDLYLLGRPILGRYEGYCSGHGLNNALVRALLDDKRAWRIRGLTHDLAEAV